MNILYRLQRFDKGNIQKICSQMEIKHTGDNTKSELINKLLLPLQTYKMEHTKNTKVKTHTDVKSQEHYNKEEMKRLVNKLDNLKIKPYVQEPYVPNKEQQERILKLMSKN